MLGKACFRLGLIALVTLAAGTAAAVKSQARGSVAAQCEPSVDPAYAQEIGDALAQKQDVWGNELLASPAGPTADGVQGYLHPLMLVGRPGGAGPRHLTDSGVYYVPFGRPDGPDGASTVQLHVADGSQIVSRDVEGPRLTVGVGRAGRERYGSCHLRLQTPRLDGGYLPVLETSYAAADGVRYQQESFATVIPETGSLVSFVRVVVNPRLAHRKNGIGYLRLTPSVRGLRQVGDELRRGDGTRLIFSDGARFNGTSLVYATKPRKALTVYLAWLDQARPTKPFELDRASYERAKRSMIRYWNRRLSQGATYAVPEKRVLDAERNLLIQNMLMSGRYSLGNAYDGWSFELIDVAEVMGDYGFGKIERAILEKSFRKRSPFPKRAAGERMVGTAHYYRRFGDTAFVDQVTPALGKFVASFENQLNASKVGILDPERYGVDVNTRVYGLHAQAQALQGLRAMSAVWAQTGHPFLAAKADRVATRLEAGIEKAVDASKVDAARRLAVRPDRAARRLRAPVRRPDRLAGRELLEPRDAVRARVGRVPSGRARGDGRARLHARARLALPRARPLPRLHEPDEPGLPRARLGRRVRPERRALPRGQRPAGPARPQPVREARRPE